MSVKTFQATILILFCLTSNATGFEVELHMFEVGLHMKDWAAKQREKLIRKYAKYPEGSQLVTADTPYYGIYGDVSTGTEFGQLREEGAVYYFTRWYPSGNGAYRARQSIEHDGVSACFYLHRLYAAILVLGDNCNEGETLYTTMLKYILRTRYTTVMGVEKDLYVVRNLHYFTDVDAHGVARKRDLDE